MFLRSTYNIYLQREVRKIFSRYPPLIWSYAICHINEHCPPILYHNYESDQWIYNAFGFHHGTLTVKRADSEDSDQNVWIGRLIYSSSLGACVQRYIFLCSGSVDPNIWIHTFAYLVMHYSKRVLTEWQTVQSLIKSHRS